ncbi:MAG: HAD-IB family phosphatase [Pseudomonadota bacterium]|nr:HAD-IB family phosphatase [Gammaproteobacteria bacterium]MBU1558600.1 HAD-IB family phosphatase [Gammaproteobacteria bacterium]MBU2546627.1 HAD-IB family phosphatase [Gammaproteobacteria bacterium]
MTGKRIVFFDLDGTLLEGLSSENVFVLHLLKKRYLGLRQWMSILRFLFRWTHRYGQYVFIKNKAYLNRLSHDEISKLGRDIVLKQLLQKLRPWMRERVERHRALGDQIILLTGAHAFMAEVFSDHLKIDRCIATQCSVNDGVFSHSPPLQHPFHKEKRSIAEEVCKQAGVDMKDCFAYGNSRNDIWLLEAVGHPYAVTPDKKLRRVAQKRKWPILTRKGIR